MKFGIDRLLADPTLRAPLKGKRVALVAHPASVTQDLTHSLDALAAIGDIKLTAAFGPQHGMRGDKQDNMIESADYTDPVHGVPVFSLYGDSRRLTGQMLSTFDVLLVDLQDLGCRIYTFITTLLYVLEAAAQHGKEVWVLDRPNPAGRPIEGLTLRAAALTFTAPHLIADFSKQRVDSAALTALGALAQAADFEGWRGKLFAGEIVNLPAHGHRHDLHGKARRAQSRQIENIRSVIESIGRRRHAALRAMKGSLKSKPNPHFQRCLALAEGLDIPKSPAIAAPNSAQFMRLPK